jgi:hypothetical protein
MMSMDIILLKPPERQKKGEGDPPPSTITYVSNSRIGNLSISLLIHGLI